MPRKNNPFKPTRPIYRGMFAGRHKEVERIETVLEETKDGNPTNLLVIGERGIGKTSLLLYSRAFAHGARISDDYDLDFMPVMLSLDKRTTVGELAKKINRDLERQLRKSDKAVRFLKDAWSFLQRVEVAGTKIGARAVEVSEAEIFDGLCYSICDTVKGVTSSGDMSRAIWGKQKDGIVVFVDEADNAPDYLDLGSLLKQLSERLVAEDCNNVLFIVAGLPDVRRVLSESHGSALRLFEEIELFPLTHEDVKTVINMGLKEANKKNPASVDIADSALDLIVRFSEGYPHFIQQFGYSAYAIDSDNLIDDDDVFNAAFSPGGALDLIGDRYYKDMYLEKIKQDSYRQVLKIMSKKWNQWITKNNIRSQFKGKETTLNNAIKALSDRKIILKRPGVRGQYRLQWMGFALWLNVFAEKLEEQIGFYNDR